MSCKEPLVNAVDAASGGPALARLVQLSFRYEAVMTAFW